MIARLGRGASRLLVLAVGAMLALALVASVPRQLSVGADGEGLTAFFADSQQGDWPGDGAQRLFLPADYNFSISMQWASRGIHFGVSSKTAASDSWAVFLAAPEGQLLEVGTYEAARDFSGVGPVISVSVSSRGCNGAGRFVVHQLEMSSPTTVERFAASFERHCGGLPAAFGEIRYNSTGIPLDALIFAPRTHSFAAPGDTASFTLSNPGTTAQDVTVGMHGPHAGEFEITSEPCTTVPVGGSCNISVAFNPLANGPREAYLIVQDETPRGHRHVNLSGNGRPFTTTTLAASPNPARAGEQITLTATVGQPSGTVVFQTPSGVLASAAVDGTGRAIATVTLAAGEHWVSAVATGATYGRSESAPLLVVIDP